MMSVILADYVVPSPSWLCSVARPVHPHFQEMEMHAVGLNKHTVPYRIAKNLSHATNMKKISLCFLSGNKWVCFWLMWNWSLGLLHRQQHCGFFSFFFFTLQFRLNLCDKIYLVAIFSILPATWEHLWDHSEWPFCLDDLYYNVNFSLQIALKEYI